MTSAIATTMSHVGLWASEDGYIRQQLFPNGRYVEARGAREGVYRGRYRIAGDHIDYIDDSGVTVSGDLRGGAIHHAGSVLYPD
ncbi:Atu4866 domain-containing protein [Ciceribacter sp. L1K23]|uniref:Atu4866 domain-containing protein n=1 Tax=unclassified Ciceribacter TaxID=2628820 RepID=UPI001ABE72C8|nr:MULTISPECIES: Atu4866 domain-containing protein [unclassified Ciceribacter]MBO3761159.1 Atu4866 domain-containing protein [Ciceribacter sp. L1K22]MBR0554672.1 Atu4866 domain-containing protein [Ciceribacter sp. L1K23]